MGWETNTGQQGFQPSQEFLVVCDSDGTVLDSMDLKHRECFIPRFVQVFGLHPISRWAREAWEYQNLRSPQRGVHRFVGLSNAIRMLAEHPKVQELGVHLWNTDALDGWIATTGRLSRGALLEAVEQGQEELALLWEWSQAVDRMVEELSGEFWMFPYVAESLERLGETADLVLYSDTPREWLEREWQGSELGGGFRLLLGEEEGTKRELVRWLVEQGGYAPRHVLVIGDSLVDYRAAKSAMALFFPILPGQEEASWYAFWTEGLERFLEDRFAGEFEEEWLAKFRSVLEQYPAPW